ncbi:ABC transporter ATP-binding protein [Streptomyces sp. NBC_01775]|uniref:ABC transporter ATP-binding protein n=1 Tax=Streptomyces sp. NBC_01775 TaxID=2975939 RepID=UPI002DD906FC|nr:ABC transporter ATP-binding protein [Streptomyces sp. NBC_01775]WSB77834.1 ABC transporter ATP-binding protein [Streptomyces sp. NBC_01775]
MNAATTATAPTTTAISVSGLVKTFGRTRALDGLDLDVASGEVHGFLGPNGAGKSTTLRVLLGLLRADTGTARLLGADPWDDAVALHQRLAYVPGDVELWPNLTGGEAIDLLARLRNGFGGAKRLHSGRRRVTGGLDGGKRAELIERFDLDPTKKGRTYSKGNRQKVAIIAALASDAELLLLDEPTAGLDPLMEVIFQDVILQAKAAGRTVLLSSHILSQVEKLCDRVSIIRLGKIVQSGTLSEMRHLTRTTIEAETDAPMTGLDTLPGIHNLRTDGDRVHFAVDGAHLDAAVRHLSGLGVRSLVSHPPTLEELMLRHYGDELSANRHGMGGIEADTSVDTGPDAEATSR